MPAVSSETRITYGGFEVGGDSDRLLDGAFRLNEGPDTASVEFSFFVSGQTEEDFASECKSVESAFRTPYQDLIVTMSGSQLLALKQSNSSGLDAQPEIVKAEDEGDTGRSRRYTVRIEFGMPANLASMSGRRESSVQIAYSGSRRRTVTFSGTWTAVGSSDARAQYTSSVTAWVTAQLSAIGGTYEKTEEEVTPSTNDKTCAFRLVYREILRAQSGSGTDDTGIVDPTLVIRRTRIGPGDSIDPSVKRLAELECRFTCSVDHDQATNLKTKWTSIRSWVIDQITAYLNGGTFAATEISPEFDEHEHRISAVIRGLGMDEGAVTLLESLVTIRDRHVLGRKKVPAWTGNVYAAYIHQAPAQLVRTVSWTYLFAAELTIFTAVQDMVAQAQKHKEIPYTEPHSPGNGFWLEIDRDVQVEAKQLGREDWTMDVTSVTGSITYEWTVDARAAGEATPAPVIYNQAVTP